MNRRTPLLTRCLGAALSGVLMLAAALVAVPANAKVPRDPNRYPASIEALAGYSPQSRCSPWAKPGTAAFADMLLRTYKTSTSLGIVRSCNVGGTSEHKEGRAFDWGVSIHSRADRRAVRSVIRWLLRRDKHGNRYAMARRLGIQYMIWNRRIWGSYAASSGWRPYNGASPHTDHVHFSLSWKGARKQTSFWHPRRGARSGPAPDRDPEPRRDRDRDRNRDRDRTPDRDRKRQPKRERGKPLPEPRPLRSLKGGPVLVDEQVKLPAGKRFGVTTEGALQAGHDYRIEVSGTYRYRESRRAVADAECSTAPRSQWQRDRSLRRRDADADHLDVYINGEDLYAEARNGQECDTDGHTYRWWFEAEHDGRVPLRVWDPKGHDDNSGRLDVRIVDLDAEPVPTEPTEPEPIVAETLEVDARSEAPAETEQSYPAGTTLRLTASGWYLLRDGADWIGADAECTIAADDRRWVSNRFSGWFDGRWQPLGDIAVDGRIDYWRPTNGASSCNLDDHTYTWDLTVEEAGPVSLVIADSDYSDNAGKLTVEVAPR